MDIIPFGRFIASVILGGLTFYIFNLILQEFMEMLSFTGTYANILSILFAAIPAVIIFFSGIRLIMVQQKRT